MPSAAEKKIKQQFKSCRSIVTDVRLEKSDISYTLGLYSKNGEYHLQTAKMIARPIESNFALNSSEISLQAQYFFKYYEAIEALTHNIRFIAYANRLGETLPVRDPKTQEHVETLIDLNFMLKRMKFTNSSRALVQNQQTNKLCTIENFEDFNFRAIEILNTSKTIIDELEKNVSKKLLTQETLDIKMHSFDRADKFIDALKSNEISLTPLLEALSNQKENKEQKTLINK